MITASCQQGSHPTPLPPPLHPTSHCGTVQWSRLVGVPLLVIGHSKHPSQCDTLTISPSPLSLITSGMLHTQLTNHRHVELLYLLLHWHHNHSHTSLRLVKELIEKWFTHSARLCRGSHLPMLHSFAFKAGRSIVSASAVRNIRGMLHRWRACARHAED